MNSDVEQVQVDFNWPGKQSRLLLIGKWFLGGLLILPHILCLLVLGVGALFGALFGWVAIIFTGRYPRGLFGYMVGVFRWSLRVGAWLLYMVDEYPPFSLGEDPNYPVQLTVAYPDSVSRWRGLFLIPMLLVFPVGIGAEVLGIIGFICVVLGSICILFVARFPPPLYGVMAGAIRWFTKIELYVLGIKSSYPTTPSS